MFVHLRVVGSVRVVERGHLVFRGAEGDGVAPPRVLLPQLRIALRHPLPVSVVKNGHTALGPRLLRR